MSKHDDWRCRGCGKKPSELSSDYSAGVVTPGYPGFLCGRCWAAGRTAPMSTSLHPDSLTTSRPVGLSDSEKVELFDWLAEHWNEMVCEMNGDSWSSTRAIDQLSDCAHRIRFADMPDESFTNVLRRLMNAEVEQRQSYVDAWCSAYVVEPREGLPAND